MEAAQKALIKKGVIAGSVIFIVMQAMVCIYGLLLMNLVPAGAPITTWRVILLSSFDLVNFVCRPLTALFLSFGGRYLIRFINSLFLIKYSELLLIGFDLLFWIGAAILFINFRQKKNK